MIYIITTDKSHSTILSKLLQAKEREYTLITQNDIEQIKSKDTVFIDEEIVMFNTPLLTEIASSQLLFFMPHPENSNTILIRKKKRIDTMTGMQRHRPTLHKRTMQKMAYDGHIILDVPLALLPARRSGLWKRPERLVSSLISHLSTEFKTHPPISLIGAQSGELFEKIRPLLGKRAIVEQEITAPQATPVLTWSTYRFYHFLNRGFHPIPITKSLARSFFMSSRRRGVADMLLSEGYTQEMMDFLDGAIDTCSYSAEDSATFTSLLHF
ncbi:hypothetical protein KAH37_02695 [bacterium]|nr:hypothetical protein [bacterium]